MAQPPPFFVLLETFYVQTLPDGRQVKKYLLRVQSRSGTIHDFTFDEPAYSPTTRDELIRQELRKIGRL